MPNFVNKKKQPPLPKNVLILPPPSSKSHSVFQTASAHLIHCLSLMTNAKTKFNKPSAAFYNMAEHS